MTTVAIKVNNIDVMVEEGATLVVAAALAGFKVPTLCFHPDVKATGSCGICMVKLEGGRMVRGCNTKVQPGKNYTTHDPEIKLVRETILQEILADHPKNCLGCRRSGSCELQDLAAEYNIRRTDLHPVIDLHPDDNSCAVTFATRYCIHCNRCVEICSNIQAVHALERFGVAEHSHIRAVGGDSLANSPCIKCGQCAAHCPVNAIRENEDINPLSRVLSDSSRYKTVQIAPAVRVSLGEEFGMESGTISTGKIYAALRLLGFDAIFDTNFGADMTVMEEGYELLQRLKSGKNLPLITTCCPSWVEYMERFHADMIPYFSSCKSPMMMTGLLTKTYYAEKKNIDPTTLFNVAVMPCTSKKEEIERPELLRDGIKDVDLVITTRELARMIKAAGINFSKLEDGQSDDLLGRYSGAGTIFGATGGVMEAALRTAAHLAGTPMESLELTDIRGLDHIKETKMEIAGQEVRIVVTHGTNNVAQVLNRIREAKEHNLPLPWHFVEVMACTGGCITGGGQIYQLSAKTRQKRTEGLYVDDRKQKERRSYENPSIIEVYDQFLGGLGSHKSHDLLHTHYTPRPVEGCGKQEDRKG